VGLSGPRFGNSVRTVSNEKLRVYRECRQKILALVEGETDLIARMASVVAVLHGAMPDFYWTGFYRMVEGELVIGPYQGTVGCLRIKLGRGVCGTTAELEKTQVVKDVHAFPGHIACDENSRSEIVVPVFQDDALIAVLDVDSAKLGTFDESDQEALEEILQAVF